MAGGKRVRRTQEERSAQMRVRLLDATIECLVEYGYSGTTTPRVAEKAGVTRGAQVHHFPSKNDLVVAAIKHLAARRTESAIKEMPSIQASDDRIGALLDYVWDVHQGPMFIATAELWIAGRTDRHLAAEMTKVEPFVNSTLFTAIAEVYPDALAQKEIRGFVYTAMDALRGILVSSFVDADPARARKRWDRAATQLREIGDSMLPLPTPPA